jgi:hypothetical protein
MTILLVILAAICKAFADAQAHHQYKVTGGFWSVAEGSFLPFTKYRFNSWHVANSLFIWAMLAGFRFHESYINWWADFAISGVLFIVIFNTFYNRVFK